MKTIEILDQYSKIIAGLLKCDSKEITFHKDGKIIGALEYYKTEDEAREDARVRNIPFDMSNYVCVRNDFSVGKYTVKYKNDEISSWRLYQMPHCCAFMVSCNVIVNTSFRNLRIGTVLNKLRQDIGRLLGYSSIICTDIEQNIHQRQLLKTNGWKDIHDVVNKRTKNRVYISVINI